MTRKPRMSHSTTTEVLDLVTRVLQEDRARTKAAIDGLLRTDGHPAAIIDSEWNDALLAVSALLDGAK